MVLFRKFIRFGRGKRPLKGQILDGFQERKLGYKDKVDTKFGLICEAGTRVWKFVIWMFNFVTEGWYLIMDTGVGY